MLHRRPSGKVDGVLAANDGLGGAVISVLEKNGLAGKVPVTGQDATVEGLQNILAGTQCMTVYKSAKQEAGALAELAIALANGEEAETTGTVAGRHGRPRRPVDPARRRVRSPRTTSRTSSTTVASHGSGRLRRRLRRRVHRRPGSPDRTEH